MRTSVLYSTHEGVAVRKAYWEQYNTVWRMWDRGQIPGSQLPTGTVIIDPPELRSTRKRTVAVYARVSRVASSPHVVPGVTGVDEPHARRNKCRLHCSRTDLWVSQKPQKAPGKDKKQRKRKKKSQQTLTRAVTHIRLSEANPGKLEALDQLIAVYLPLCQQYVSLLCAQEAAPDKFADPVFETVLSDRLHRAVIQQAAGIAKSWRTNRQAAYDAYLEALADWKQAQEQKPDPDRKEPQWREWKVPELRVPCIQANANIVVVEQSEDSIFYYWLRISTLDKGHPLHVPVKLAAYHRQAIEGKTLNTSTTLHKRHGVWWLTLSFDEDVPLQTESSAPCVGVDVGIASATRGRVHNCFTRLSRRNEAYCSTSSTLERRSGEVTSRCRSPLTTFLNHPIADRTVRGHQYLLASERIGS